MPGNRAKRRERKQVHKAAFHQEQLKRRRAREEYVRRVSITGNVLCPFWNEDHHKAAVRYIDTGIESLKTQFPSKVRR